jgi:hypothetical protein
MVMQQSIAPDMPIYGYQNEEQNDRWILEEFYMVAMTEF